MITAKPNSCLKTYIDKNKTNSEPASSKIFMLEDGLPDAMLQKMSFFTGTKEAIA